MSTRLGQTILSTTPISNGRRVELTFGRENGSARIPAVLLLPGDDVTTGHAGPAALLLHGFSSRKEQMAETVGASLLAKGIASLSIDLPLHGERIAEGNETSWGVVGGYDRVFDASAMRSPLALAGAWRTAQQDARLAIAYLGARREVDRASVAVVGYSMGSFLGVHVAAEEPSVRALVLAAGGDFPERMPYARALRLLNDPLRAVRRLDGRPLLMLHGRHDPTVRPEQAQRLFDSAREPKELRWYDAGHHLPARALDDAAGWLTERLAVPAAFIETEEPASRVG
ncbi:MAG TPA: alpha/beta hydrolase [Gemmatimonadaceae bacterium]|nr:alpha/beta hydrolase [Gemmatimonadaceae bacterium]